MSGAPGHFEYDDDFHCYVSCQPRTQDETTKMISVAWEAELECIRYRGTDPNILRRLAELELRDVCDVEPPANIVPVIRNHIRFTDSLGSVVTSKQLLQEFISYLGTRSSEYVKYRTRKIKASRGSSSFEFAWYEKHFHPVKLAEISDSSNDWHIEYPLIGDLGDRGVGRVISEWLQSNSDQFTNLRWYTDNEWRKGGPSQATLW